VLTSSGRCSSYIYYYDMNSSCVCCRTCRTSYICYDVQFMCLLQEMLADLNRVSTMMQDVAGIVGRLPETSGDEDNEEKCKLSFHSN